MSEDKIFDIEKVKENHNLFIFGNPKTSKPIENEKELDYGFPSELGRVHFELQEDGNYYIKIYDDLISEKFIEATLTLDKLTSFFYNPSLKNFYELTGESK